MNIRKAIIAIGLALMCSSAMAQYGDPSRYIRRDDTTVTTPATLSCQGSNGNVIQSAYNGFYAGPDGTQFALIIQGHDLAVFVLPVDGNWLEGAANTGPSSTSLNVPLASPKGATGVLNICASNLTTDGFCSRLSAGLTINGATRSNLQGYIRSQTPNVPYCVKALSDKPSAKQLEMFERAKALLSE